jgi:hypothetical protein
VFYERALRAISEANEADAAAQGVREVAVFMDHDRRELRLEIGAELLEDLRGDAMRRRAAVVVQPLRDIRPNEALREGSCDRT